MLGLPKTQKLVISGTNVVAMARHGPILNDNEAMGSGQIFKYLPGLQDTTQKYKMAAKAPESQNAAFYRIFLYRLYILFGVLLWDHFCFFYSRQTVTIVQLAVTGSN